ncbi:MAG: hypothetical protein WD200_03120 [Candidatus Andersenbacteria bacterium]
MLHHLVAAGRTIANEVWSDTIVRRPHRSARNIHGKKIMPLDHFAHKTLCYHPRRSGQVSYIASEEAGQPVLAGDDSFRRNP